MEEGRRGNGQSMRKGNDDRWKNEEEGRKEG